MVHVMVIRRSLPLFVCADEKGAYALYDMYRYICVQEQPTDQRTYAEHRMD